MGRRIGNGKEEEKRKGNGNEGENSSDKKRSWERCWGDDQSVKCLLRVQHHGVLCTLAI